MNAFDRLRCRPKLRIVSVMLFASAALAGFTQLLHLDKSETLALWTVALLVGASALALLEQAAHYMVGSIVQLAARAHSIAEGDLTSGSPVVDGPDELGDLARSMDLMHLNLRDMVGAAIEASTAVHRDTGELGRVGARSFERTREITSQIHPAATAMQEMSISIAEVSSHAQHAADQAHQAAAIARQGGNIVEEMLAGMSTISDSVTQTAQTVQRLGKESEQIIRIVNVIEEIAQKTNLLALNAAIEAARAGEQGRGFAVVAGEVRRLAESTRNATSEIAQMIEGIQDHTQAAVQAMSSGTERVSHGMHITAQAGESLKRIIGAAEQVEAMIAQIATGSTQQSVAAQQFSQNLEVINRLAQEHAAAIPLTQSLLQSLQSGAQRLLDHIGRFRVADDQPAARPAPSLQRAVLPAHACGD